MLRFFFGVQALQLNDRLEYDKGFASDFASLKKSCGAVPSHTGDAGDEDNKTVLEQPGKHADTQLFGII